MNGLLAVSGPTSDGEGIRALWSRLSSRNGLTLVCRTVTVGDWTPDPWTYGNTAQKDD
ncbi:MAG: hypothetical protein JWO69_2014 [Thermoleophilia bacterium]|nr:hypothetical protein [Thermoleophilia bacterium]